MIALGLALKRTGILCPASWRPELPFHNSDCYDGEIRYRVPETPERERRPAGPSLLALPTKVSGM